jgi:superoxide reductase
VEYLGSMFVCSNCGNVVEIVGGPEAQLMCCSCPMDVLEPKYQEEGAKKHVPIIEEGGNGVTVRVGETEHPMTANHYVMRIELLTAEMAFRVELEPGDKPGATFPVAQEDIIELRSLCSEHGLWRAL